MDYRHFERVLFEELRQLIEECQQSGLEFVLVGALALRPHARRYRRLTRDLDIVVPQPSMEAAVSSLLRLGYRVERAPEWLSGVKEVGGVEVVVDVMGETIREPTTEQGYRVQVAVAATKMLVSPAFEDLADLTCSAPVIPLEDAIILKLLSARDKDLIDLTGLLLESFDQIDLDALQRKIVEARLSMAMSMAVAEWRSALDGGNLGYLWEATYDRPLTDADAADLRAKLEQLLPG